MNFFSGIFYIPTTFNGTLGDLISSFHIPANVLIQDSPFLRNGKPVASSGALEQPTDSRDGPRETTTAGTIGQPGTTTAGPSGQQGTTTAGPSGQQGITTAGPSGQQGTTTAGPSEQIIHVTSSTTVVNSSEPSEAASTPGADRSTTATILTAAKGGTSDGTTAAAGKASTQLSSSASASSSLEPTELRDTGRDTEYVEGEERPPASTSYSSGLTDVDETADKESAAPLVAFDPTDIGTWMARHNRTSKFSGIIGPFLFHTLRDCVTRIIVGNAIV